MPVNDFRNNDVHRRVPVNHGVCPGFGGACDTVLTQKPIEVTAYDLVCIGTRDPATRSSGSVHFVYTKCVFEWDPRKAEANAAKHGVSFEDAVTVFLDPEALDGPDLQHSSAESRFLRLGRSAVGHVLMVAYMFRRSGDAEAIRIISARRASRRERAAYAATD